MRPSERASGSVRVRVRAMSAPASVVNTTNAYGDVGAINYHNAAPAAAPAESSSVATAVPVAAAAAAPAPKRKRARGTGCVLQVPSGKWRGLYSDVSERNGKKPKTLNTKCFDTAEEAENCLLYTSPSPRDRQKSRMPSSA